MIGHEAQLRRLTMHDPVYLEAILADRGGPLGLDPHALALVRLGVLVAQDGPPSAFEWVASSALAAGASPQELVDVLVATAPLVGSSHVVSAAPRLARALGYDVDADLEGSELGSEQQ